MICYLDRTFCSAECVNSDCFRNYSHEVHEGAKKWWGGDDYPIEFCDFSKDCKEFEPHKEMFK